MASRRLQIAVLCFLLILLSYLLAWTYLASAHAEYERSEPAAGAVIPAAPTEVHIWFTQELFRRAGVNVIEVSGPDGSRVDQGDTRLDDDDRKHLFVALQPDLPPGLYSVSWRNLSLEDGHEGSGEFSFTIDPAANDTVPQSSPPAAQQVATATPTSLPSLTPTSAPTATAAPEPTPSPSSGLPCLGGLLLGGIFMVISGRFKRGQAAC